MQSVVRGRDRLKLNFGGWRASSPLSGRPFLVAVCLAVVEESPWSLRRKCSVTNPSRSAEWLTSLPQGEAGVRCRVRVPALFSSESAPPNLSVGNSSFPISAYLGASGISKTQWPLKSWQSLIIFAFSFFSWHRRGGGVQALRPSSATFPVRRGTFIPSSAPTGGAGRLR